MLSKKSSTFSPFFGLFGNFVVDALDSSCLVFIPERNAFPCSGPVVIDKFAVDTSHESVEVELIGAFQLVYGLIVTLRVISKKGKSI